MLVCLALTLISMFTPSWTKTEQESRQYNNNFNIPHNFGLFQFNCVLPGQDFRSNNCAQWFDVRYFI